MSRHELIIEEVISVNNREAWVKIFGGDNLHITLSEIKTWVGVEEKTRKSISYEIRKGQKNILYHCKGLCV
jgi:hypothetical protein